MAISDWRESERPRERLLAHGPAALSDAELVAVLLRTGVRGKTAVDLARELIERCQGIGGLLDRVGSENMKGLGSAKRAQFAAAIELARRSLAERIVYGALDGCKDKTGNDPVVTLKRALDNVKPTLEVRSRRVGGATYQVPVEVRASRSTTLALRWLVSYSRSRREKTMTERLMNELLDASNGLGASVKRREDTHKMAESNKAFAHYRW